MSKARKPTKYLVDRRYDDIIKYSGCLSDEEWVAEDEAAFNDPNNIVVIIPCELLPAGAGRHPAGSRHGRSN